MNTPWQDIICRAAVDSTLKGNENLVFRLKWRDLAVLCYEMGSLGLHDWSHKPEGVAISARVWCHQLRRQVIVNEWVGESSTGA
jgi:hypothetical protein